MTKEGDKNYLRRGFQNETNFLRNRVVSQLVERGFIRNKKIEDAFRKVPRHIFLPGIEPQEVYSDVSIITKKIGIEPISSSTQLSLMASMLEILHLKKGMKVLEIGAGTGYNAAIMAELVGDERKIISVDIDAETVEEAQQNLAKAGYKGVTIKCADGAKGFTENAPYDRIIVTCSIRNILIPLIKQLKEDGIMVLPIWFNGTQITPALEKQRNGDLISLSATIGGLMDIRSKTFQEIQVEPSKKEAEELLICSEHPEMFPEEKIKSLLQSPHQEKELPLKEALSQRGGDFFIFLALHEKKSVELFVETDANEFAFGDSAAGIVDLENNSACLISRNNKLFIYGNLSTYRKLLSLSKRWERLKKPGVDKLQVFVFMHNQITLQKNDLIFREKFPTIVVRIL
ncbi:hypothetical protein CO054_02130 [Candidatus Shapirobacteria bacterium CG_4_9_14_0_2_um_filter_39_11]|uniref:Protein-L-isoaspartate O-methyltransferase n=1 Tax=Candidatus Shapirobacteria bacterium CG_4_9_14_0_2_um_filter_39_11 TaxID=1974478 RepID=A0A2M8ESI2_9BACT|nr:MAG: hypothetical protein CO054_02130 [Candidatus Shapirobacteria bacterium CG_4_9_14_0_2_um_filter_39_11]